MGKSYLGMEKSNSAKIFHWTAGPSQNRLNGREETQSGRELKLGGGSGGLSCAEGFKVNKHPLSRRVRTLQGVRKRGWGVTEMVKRHDVLVRFETVRGGG